MSHTPNNLSEMFASRLNQLNGEIVKVEDTIYNLETDYLLQDSTQIGSVFKGFEGFLSSKETQKASRRAGLRTYKTEDRLFSLSSTTSPATRELANPPDDSAVDGPMPIRGKGNYATKGIAMKQRRNTGSTAPDLR